MDISALYNHIDQPRSMIKEQSCKAHEPPILSPLMFQIENYLIKSY